MSCCRRRPCRCSKPALTVSPPPPRPRALKRRTRSHTHIPHPTSHPGSLPAITCRSTPDYPPSFLPAKRRTTPTRPPSPALPASTTSPDTALRPRRCLPAIPRVDAKRQSCATEPSGERLPRPSLLLCAPAPTRRCPRPPTSTIPLHRPCARAWLCLRPRPAKVSQPSPPPLPLPPTAATSTSTSTTTSTTTTTTTTTTTSPPPGLQRLSKRPGGTVRPSCCFGHLCHSLPNAGVLHCCCPPSLALLVTHLCATFMQPTFTLPNISLPSANPLIFPLQAPIQASAPRALAAFRNPTTPNEVCCDSTLLPTLSRSGALSLHEPLST